MELCETCTKEKCSKRIVVIEKPEIKITKCLDYTKDQEKIQGYVKPKERTAKVNRSIMGLSNPSWS